MIPIVNPIAALATAWIPVGPAGVLAALQADGAAEEGSGGGGSFLIPMILIIGVFYVVLILPERRKQKKRQEMLGALKKGDRVITASGLYGSVAQVQENVVTLQVADGVRLRFSRAAIQTILSADEEAPKQT